MYTARPDNGKSYEVSITDSSVLIDSNVFEWDLTMIRENHYQIFHDQKSYHVEVVNIDRQTKIFTFKINGTSCSVELRDKFDHLLEKLGMTGGGTTKINSIKAPMPGLIIDLRVLEGDRVASGDPLLILEAMKMENIIKAPGNAIVKSVKVKKGDSVEKGQIILEFD